MPEQLDAKDIGQRLVAPYRELTVAAVVLGIVQGIIINIAFAYVALKIGFGIGGSTVAAIMGYALLTGVMKRGTSVENNINQTIASGINVSGSGVVFTLPALFMLNAAWTAQGETGIQIDPLPLMIGGVAGAILGTVLIIPLRKQMVEMDRLRFPSGIAVTTIIRSGRAGVEKAKLLAIGVGISVLWKIVLIAGWLEFPGLVEEEILHFGFGVIPLYLAPMIGLSVLNAAAGMLTGKGGLPLLIGGVLAWWVIAPASVVSGWTPGEFPISAEEEAALQQHAHDQAIPMETLYQQRYQSQTKDFLYGRMLRPTGIGVLIGGALMGVIVCFPAIVNAFRSFAQAAKTAGSGSGKVEEMPLNIIIACTLVGVVLLFTAAALTEGVSVGQAALTAVVGTVWLAVAGLIVSQAAGMTDISPISGMALISVTIMMFLLGGNVAGAMVLGVAVCVGIGQSADMMQDLKTGHMLGAKPIKQQIVQFAFPWIGAMTAIGLVFLLWQSGPGGQGGFGEGTSLPAPQGGALMGIISAVQSGNVPVDKYLMGGTIGVLLGAAPVSGLGVLIGLSMYLPFYMSLGYGIGCLIHIFLRAVKGPMFCQHKLVPFAAGLIVGEALTGVGYAIYEILVSALQTIPA